MTNPEMDNGITRDDLVQRVALMETMIAEGRRSTARFGWIFVLWGLVDLFGIGWEVLRPSNWVWPVTIGGGVILFFAGLALRRRSGTWRSTTVRSRSISTVWSMMGVATWLYCFTAIFRHQTTSALILRWGV
jgi:hypothetical protein